MALFLLFTVICWMFVDSESAGLVQKTVSAAEGETVSLPCEAPNNETIRVVSWTRLDLKKDQYVLFYRNGRFNPNNHPSYRNRVELKDVRDGDASLILKNVTFSDRGTYQCFILQGGRSNKPESLSLVSLSVVPPPGDTGRVGEGGGEGRGRVGLPVAVQIVVVVGGIFGVVMCKKRLKRNCCRHTGSDPDLSKPLNRAESESLTGVSVFSSNRDEGDGDHEGQTGH